jgi:hypothetical protein
LHPPSSQGIGVPINLRISDSSPSGKSPAIYAGAEGNPDLGF